jgi:hypothetical protein
VLHTWGRGVEEHLPWSRSLKFHKRWTDSVFYNNQHVHYLFSKSIYLSLSKERLIHSTRSHNIYFRIQYDTVLYSHLCLDLSSDPFPSGSLSKILYVLCHLNGGMR